MIEEMITNLADSLLRKEQPTLQDVEDCAADILPLVRKNYPRDYVTKQFIIDIIAADRKITKMVQIGWQNSEQMAKATLSCGQTTRRVLLYQCRLLTR